MGFANFYLKFIKELCKIIALLTSMLQTTLRPTITTVKKFNKDCNSKVKDIYIAILEKTQSIRNEECVGVIITKKLFKLFCSKA